MSSNTIKITPTYFPGSKINFALSFIEENLIKEEEAKSSILGARTNSC